MIEPKELVPLAKLSPDDPTTVEVFEWCINGQEIAPGERAPGVPPGWGVVRK